MPCGFADGYKTSECRPELDFSQKKLLLATLPRKTRSHLKTCCWSMQDIWNVHMKRLGRGGDNRQRTSWQAAPCSVSSAQRSRLWTQHRRGSRTGPVEYFHDILDIQKNLLWIKKSLFICVSVFVIYFFGVCHNFLHSTGVEKMQNLLDFIIKFLFSLSIIFYE